MTLYLVGTPIGNLEDITLRALRVLKEVALIAAEDTRHTRKLLNHLEITTPLVSYHEHSKDDKVAELVEKAAVMDVALVSDAGMPALSDPGYRLVRACVDAGISIIPIPGPTAAVTALVSSGLPTDSFLFLGFLPRATAARQSSLREVVALPYTFVLYESPHRLLGLLADIQTVFGDRQVCVGRELTKMYEEIWRGSAAEATAHFETAKVRGEVTVIVAGAEKEVGQWDEKRVREAMAERLANGERRKGAAQVVATLSGWKKRDVYQLDL